MDDSLPLGDLAKENNAFGEALVKLAFTNQDLAPSSRSWYFANLNYLGKTYTVNYEVEDIFCPATASSATKELGHCTIHKLRMFFFFLMIFFLLTFFQIQKMTVLLQRI